MRVSTMAVVDNDLIHSRVP